MHCRKEHIRFVTENFFAFLFFSGCLQADSDIPRNVSDSVDTADEPTQPQRVSKAQKRRVHEHIKYLSS
jgi:hypothetical protein